jgi:thiosulfate/3-mercaptopyruvate sulfurtransferase
VADSPLVTPPWLRDNLGEPHVVVADVRWYLKDKRGIDAYRAGHIPSAVFVDVDRDLSSPPGPGRPGRHPLPSPEQFADVLARIGVERDDLVVAYDDTGGSTAARLWWLFKYFGLDGGRVLDGGLQAWVASGYPLETASASRAVAPRMTLVPSLDLVVDKKRVREMSERGEGLLLDARASERFEGRVEPIDARPGHIPGAKSAPFTDNLSAPGGAFLPKSELDRHYAALGAATARPIVAYCGSGVTSCHDLLALAILGRDDALLYEGSWSEWASDVSLPAASGKT